MKYTKEEIIKTVTVIQETCNEMTSCVHCPFYNDSIEDCLFNGGISIYDWEIIEENPLYWRVTKN